MRNYEKDAIILGLISNFLKGTNRDISDYVHNFDRDKFNSYTEDFPCVNDGEQVAKALKYIATESYKRLSKKFDEMVNYEPKTLS
jgi:hypothetical protein